ncbi:MULTISPECIES: TetR family transcriptional regulator C-terminal domain-containing protein [Novosphingobium]|uniref:TetR family transcriptional regulator C-terminal domain-containing protein n=1 Tax=Novosphingobium TaxID=165696 RepID=UPI001CD4AAF0|nr:TetR family transcriptional regulator C-terminal domain-containing protein [Novosphingobium percolationis]
MTGASRAAKAARLPKGQAKREEILTGLMAALNRGELRNPSLKAIGRTLGLEPAHILYYFGSREALMQAVIRRSDADNTSQGNKGDGDGEMSLDGFAEVVRANLARPGVVHLYLAFAAEAVDPLHPAHDFVQTRFEHVKLRLAAAIRREQGAGTVAERHDPDIEARLLIALADGLQLQSLIDPQVDAVRHIRAAVEALRN